MATPLVVVDDRDKDAAAVVLARVLAERGSSKVVKLSNFLRSAGVSADGHRGLLHVEPQRARARLQDVRIYNRVVRISAETAAALDGGQRTIPRNFVFAVYAQILGVCDDVVGAPGIESPVGDLLPLHLQWRRVDETLAGCRTPRFDFGVGTETLDVSTFRKPVFKSPFDPYDWESLATGHVPSSDAFVVDRPEGNAVILSFAGDASDVFPLSSGVELTASARAELSSYAPALARTFKAFMGEALFFVAPAATTFGAFSHYLRTSAKRRSFVELIGSAIS